MGELIAFPLQGGGNVLVEVHESQAKSNVPVYRGGVDANRVTAKAQQTFEDAVHSVAPAAQAIVAQLREMSQTPDEIHVEFGLDLHAEAGAFVAAASASANFKISMTWRSRTNTEQSSGH